jgi:hypothetical protein
LFLKKSICLHIPSSISRTSTNYLHCLGSEVDPWTRYGDTRIQSCRRQSDVGTLERSSVRQEQCTVETTDIDEYVGQVQCCIEDLVHHSSSSSDVGGSSPDRRKLLLPFQCHDSEGESEEGQSGGSTPVHRWRKTVMERFQKYGPGTVRRFPREVVSLKTSCTTVSILYVTCLQDVATRSSR